MAPKKKPAKKKTLPKKSKSWDKALRNKKTGKLEFLTKREIAVRKKAKASKGKKKSRKNKKLKVRGAV